MVITVFIWIYPSVKLQFKAFFFNLEYAIQYTIDSFQFLIRFYHFRYYADLEKKRCPEMMNVASINDSQSSVAVDHNACYVWRRFAK